MASPRSEGSRIPRAFRRDVLGKHGVFRPNRVVGRGSLKGVARPETCNRRLRGTIFGASRLWYMEFVVPSLRSGTRYDPARPMQRRLERRQRAGSPRTPGTKLLITYHAADQCASVGFPGGLKFLIHNATATATRAGIIRPTKQSK